MKPFNRINGTQTEGYTETDNSAKKQLWPKLNATGESKGIWNILTASFIIPSFLGSYV